MNRRTFLKVAGATTCVVVRGIVGGIKVANMVNQTEALARLTLCPIQGESFPCFFDKFKEQR
jgi:hypothetical protein